MDLANNILALAGIAAVVIIGRLGLLRLMYGMSDPQNSNEAAGESLKGCGLIVVALAVFVWAIVSLVRQDLVFL